MTSSSSLQHDTSAAKENRLYTLEGLSLRLKTSKKRVSRPRVVQSVALTPHERWSLDFVSDT